MAQGFYPVAQGLGDKSIDCIKLRKDFFELRKGWPHVAQFETALKRARARKEFLEARKDKELRKP